MRIAYVFSSDSFAKVGAILHEESNRRGLESTLILLRDSEFFGRDISSNNEHLKDFGLNEFVTCEKIDDLIKNRILNFQYVFLLLPGAAIHKLTRRLRAHCKTHHRSEPYIITGYCGLNVKNFEASLVERSASDLIFLNSQEEFEIAKAFMTQWGDVHRPELLVSGLVVLDDLKNFTPKIPNQRIRRILFAAQPSLPKAAFKRKILLQQYLELAYKNQDIEFLFKPRLRPNESTFHQEDYPYQKLLETILREKGELAPKNFKFVYGPMKDLLPQVDMLVSMGSTALAEAYALGVQPRVIADLDLEDPSGVPYFACSGWLRSFAQLQLEVGQAVRDTTHEKWLLQNLPMTYKASELIFTFLLERKGHPSQSGLNTYLNWLDLLDEYRSDFRRGLVSSKKFTFFKKVYRGLKKFF